MDPLKKDILTKNVIGEIQKYNTGKEGNFMECPMCLDNMCKKDILFGSCGHCLLRLYSFLEQINVLYVERLPILINSMLTDFPLPRLQSITSFAL